MRFVVVVVFGLLSPVWAAEAAFDGQTTTTWARKLAETRSAADELARGGANAVPVLDELLRTQRGPALDRTVWALGGLGGEARDLVPALTRLLRSKDDQQRTAGARGFMRIGAHGSAAVPMLATALRDRVKEVANNAGYALGDIGKGAVPALVAALGADESAVRGRAADALGTIGPDAAPAVPGLIRLLRDSEAGWRARGEAAEALGDIGAHIATAVPALMAGLSDEEDWVRRHCADALGELGEPARDTAPLLIARASDPKEDVREAAAEAIWKLGAPAIAKLVETFRASTNRAPLIEVFAAGGRRSIEPLIALLDDKHATRDSERALARIGWEALVALPRDSDATRRITKAVLNDGVRRMVTAPEGYKVVLEPAVSAAAENVTLNWETGSGHGFTLSLYSTRWTAAGLEVRRIRYRWRRGRRAGERAVERVLIDSTVMPRGRARAMLPVLFAATGLRIQKVQSPTRFMSSSADFHLSLAIRSDRPLFSQSFTGYSGTSNEPKYACLEACETILDQALETCTWKRESPADQDRAAIAQRLDRVQKESWWVAERLLLIAHAIGDRRCLPALRRYIKSPVDNVPRDHRYAINAYAHISGLDLRPKPFADKDVAATRAKYVAAFPK